MSPTPDAARSPALEAKLRRCLAREIFAYERCDSTMERAHALVREGIAEGALVFAQRQEQGRGRLGRAWESPEGGAYFSLILRPARPMTEVPQLSLVAGLAVVDTIQPATVSSAQSDFVAKRIQGRSKSEIRLGHPSPVVAIRWPNDVLINDKKVAGILTEARNGAVVVGIGINATTDATQLPDTATSLAALGVAGDPYQLVAEVCRAFDGWYDVWTAQGFAPIRQALRPWMSHLGDLVRLDSGGAHVEGQAADLDESGRLVVRLDSGVMQAFEAGEVTLLR